MLMGGKDIFVSHIHGPANGCRLERVTLRQNQKERVDLPRIHQASCDPAQVPGVSPFQPEM